MLWSRSLHASRKEKQLADCPGLLPGAVCLHRRPHCSCPEVTSWSHMSSDWTGLVAVSRQLPLSVAVHGC